MSKSVICVGCLGFYAEGKRHRYRTHRVLDGERIGAMRKLIGTVQPGSRDSSTMVMIDNRVDELSGLLGCDVVPGTLNVFCNRPIRFRGGVLWDALGRTRRFIPATLNGHDIYICDLFGRKVYLIELVGDIHLRSTFKLQDEDVLEIFVDENYVDNPSLLDWFRFYRHRFGMTWLGERVKALYLRLRAH